MSKSIDASYGGTLISDLQIGHVVENNPPITSLRQGLMDELRQEGQVSTTASNNEVERRGNASTTNEAALSQSSTPSLAHRRYYPRDRSNRLLDRPRPLKC